MLVSCSQLVNIPVARLSLLADSGWLRILKICIGSNERKGRGRHGLPTSLLDSEISRDFRLVEPCPVQMQVLLWVLWCIGLIMSRHVDASQNAELSRGFLNALLSIIDHYCIRKWNPPLFDGSDKLSVVRQDSDAILSSSSKSICCCLRYLSCRIDL